MQGYQHMQAVEAMQRLITIADLSMIDVRGKEGLSEAEQQALMDNETAIAIIQAMLNTALPVARFRCYVEIETALHKELREGEFTVCAVDIKGIEAGLLFLARRPAIVKVHLFEQRQAGAEMIHGFEGRSGGIQFRRYVEGLLDFQSERTVN